jgi:hypothetical protein
VHDRHVVVLAPSAIVASVMIGDCRSVANPGNGLVITLIGRSGFSLRTWTTAPLAANSTPICSSFQRTTPR